MTQNVRDQAMRAFRVRAASGAIFQRGGGERMEGAGSCMRKCEQARPGSAEALSAQPQIPDAH
eukprot:357077-Chlamydomonas_euryale.AAC.1